jgi:signal transduction histidine kinase
MKPTISDNALMNDLKKELEKNDQHLNEQKELLLQLNKVNGKLLASENLKSNFLSNIRNEINNPLASVLELSKNIAEGHLNADQVKKFAGLIYSEIFNLDFQLRNIFFSAEIEAGEIGLSAVSVNISTIIQNVIGALKHQVEKKKLNILFTNGIPGNSLFFTDSEKLHLILSNVFANAIQFSHEEGTIEVKAYVNEGRLKISVLDYGVGISDENKNLIFDRFRQGEEGSTKNYGGHGLGLSICKALLEIINGQLIVESEPQNGSLFTLLIDEVQKGDNKETVFSSDGNDFLFNDNESLIF